MNDRLKFLGSIGVPYRVVKTKSEFDHSCPAAPLAVSCSFLRSWSAVTQICGSGSVADDASVFVSSWTRHAADALELKLHRDFPGIQIYVLPRETQHLTTPEAKNEDQYVRRVERIVDSLCGFEELPGLFHGPGIALDLPSGPHLDLPGDVLRDHFLGHGIRQR